MTEKTDSMEKKEIPVAVMKKRNQIELEEEYGVKEPSSDWARK